MKRWFIKLGPKTASDFQGASLVNRHTNEVFSVINGPETMAVFFNGRLWVGFRHRKDRGIFRAPFRKL